MESWIIVAAFGIVLSFLGRLYGYVHKESLGYTTELGVIWGIIGLAIGVGVAGFIRYMH
jgi:hypothetical protein